MAPLLLLLGHFLWEQLGVAFWLMIPNPDDKEGSQ